jgi:hypothetical protein
MSRGLIRRGDGACGLSDDRLKLDEPEDDVAVALARPAHGPQAVEDGGAFRPYALALRSPFDACIVCAKRG